MLDLPTIRISVLRKFLTHEPLDVLSEMYGFPVVVESTTRTGIHYLSPLEGADGEGDVGELRRPVASDSYHIIFSPHMKISVIKTDDPRIIVENDDHALIIRAEILMSIFYTEGGVPYPFYKATSLDLGSAYYVKWVGDPDVIPPVSEWKQTLAPDEYIDAMISEGLTPVGDELFL